MDASEGNAGSRPLEPIYSTHSPSAVNWPRNNVLTIFATVFDVYFNLRLSVTYLLSLENLQHESNNATMLFLYTIAHKPAIGLPRLQNH